VEIQEIIIALTFTGALGYLGRMGWQQVQAGKNAGCAKGCGSCGAIDFKKIEAEIARQQPPVQQNR
jgi:hypothetical protein